MEFWHALLPLVARLAIAPLFLWAGWRKIRNWSATKSSMQTKQVKYVQWLLPVAVFLQIGGGLSVLLGFYARIGALLLIAFTLPATAYMHDFWNLSGKERTQETAHFLKDLAIVGALLLLLLTGAGRVSVLS